MCSSDLSDPGEVELIGGERLAALVPPLRRPAIDRFVRELLVGEGTSRGSRQAIRSPEDPEGRDIFESDEELHEFLEYTYVARRTELA